MARPGILEEREQAVLRESAEVTQPFGAVEVGEAEVIAREHCAGLLEQRTELTPGDRRVVGCRVGHQRGRISVPTPAVTNSAVTGPSTSAVCHTPGGFTIA